MSTFPFKGCLLVLTGLWLGGAVSAQQPGTVRWKVPLDSPYRNVSYNCSPAIGPDGTIYVSNGAADTTVGGNRLYALSPQGTTNWVFTAGGALRSSPAVAANGTIYIGGMDQNLYAVSPSGATNWVFPTEGWLPSSPALGADGTVYINAVSNYVNKLYAVNPDGTAKWGFSMVPISFWSGRLGGQFSSPAIGPDGTIYVGSVDTNLYAIRPDGTAKWVRSLGLPTASSPAIGADGTIYIGSDNGWYAFAPDGSERWPLVPQYASEASAAIASDGTVYVATLGKTYALSPQETQLWTAPGGSGSPALAADGTCYCVGSATLYAVNSSGATVWSYPLSMNGWIFSSPAIGADGTLYIVAGPYLWAFYGGSPLQQSPWAMFRREPTHNARALQRALSAPTLQPNGAFALTLGLDIGRTYEVQASTNLANWTTLTNFTSTNAAAQFIDWEARNFPQRFYRLVVPEAP